MEVSQCRKYHAVSSGTEIVNMADEKSAMSEEALNFKSLKYRRYPCNFDNPLTAGHSQLGWISHNLNVRKDETALILIHLWNHGYPGGMEWSKTSPNLGHAQLCEWVGRCRVCFDEKIPKIVKAARRAGIQIIHVTSNDKYAKKYEQYKTTLQEVTEPEPEKTNGAIIRNDAEWFPDELQNGPDFEKDSKGIEYDFPPHLKPEGNDLVTVTTHELNTLLRNRKIWHLNYCGFAINVCLWHSPCGMFDMKHLGYRCGCIKQGSVAVESAESALTEGNHAYAMWWTAMHYGWIMEEEDFIAACG